MRKNELQKQLSETKACVFLSILYLCQREAYCFCQGQLILSKYTRGFREDHHKLGNYNNSSQSYGGTVLYTARVSTITFGSLLKDWLFCVLLYFFCSECKYEVRWISTSQFAKLLGFESEKERKGNSVWKIVIIFRLRT